LKEWLFLKGCFVLGRCEKVLIEREQEKQCGSANYSLELNATELHTLANCSSALCALEQVSTEKEFFLVKYIQEYLLNENLQGANNFRLI
jgi:hypothetical protein